MAMSKTYEPPKKRKLGLGKKPNSGLEVTPPSKPGFRGKLDIAAAENEQPVDLFLTDEEGEQKQDELLGALTRMAYKTPLVKEVKIDTAKSKWKSKFFFKPSKSFDESLAKVKQQSKKAVSKDIEIFEGAITKRTLEYSKDLPPALGKHIDGVREFFLSELGPRIFATNVGGAQAKDIAQKVLQAEVDPSMFAKFDRMTAVAADIRMARFVARYMKLSVKDAQEILAASMPALYRRLENQPQPSSSSERRPAQRGRGQDEDNRQAQVQQGQKSPNRR